MLIYLVQATLCWGLFALLYTVLLRRETFFCANRAYLLATLLLGAALPVFAAYFPILDAMPAPANLLLPAVDLGGLLTMPAESAKTGYALLPVVYGAGALLAAIRLSWGIAKLLRMVSAGRKERLSPDCLLIRTPEAQLPFSFFSWVFVPVDFDVHQTENRNMLDHEYAHVRGRHSADVLLAELGCILFWFHPLVHWYRRSLRTVHEYLADAEASDRSDRRQYGLLLLRQAQPMLAFANHFFQAPLKQRLLMLTRQASPSSRYWKYALVLPLTALLISAFQGSPATQTDFSHTVFSPAELDQQPEYPGGMPALIAYLSENIHYPDEARKVRAEGTLVLELTLANTGEIQRVKTISPANSTAIRQDMTDEALRVVKAMPAWKPAQRQGNPVSCRVTLPIRFKLE